MLDITALLELSLFLSLPLPLPNKVSSNIRQLLYLVFADILKVEDIEFSCMFLCQMYVFFKVKMYLFCITIFLILFKPSIGYPTFTQLLPGIIDLDHPTLDVITVPDGVSEEQTKAVFSLRSPMPSSYF